MTGHWRRLAVVVALPALLTGSCGDDDGGDAGEAELVIADVERVAADPAAAADAGAAQAALGTDLYAVLRTGDGNLAISPYSVAVALAMTRAGAAGTTAEEMDRVLHAELTDDLHAAFGSLDAALAERPGTFEAPDGEALELELSFANALWPQAGFEFVDGFLETLAAGYGAGVRPLDYAADAESARRTINDWVAGETRDRIPELIPEGVLDPLTRLVLTNALYLKAPWQFPFTEGATTPSPFARLDGTTVEAPTMQLFEELRYADGGAWQAVELPYVGDDLAMVVVVPDGGAFADVEAGLDAAFVDEVAGSLAATSVRLGLPSWEFRTQVALTDPLQELGMPSAFGDGADFSAMSPTPLQITDVLHEVWIAVDEEGTEAAAATAVVVGETAAPLEPVELTVDRPFLFWIVDRPTGALLFLGRVLDPIAD